jgi:hypothetical protein
MRDFVILNEVKDLAGKPIDPSPSAQDDIVKAILRHYTRYPGIGIGRMQREGGLKVDNTFNSTSRNEFPLEK